MVRLTKLIPCVCFILVDKNSFLVEQRSLKKKVDPGLVTIPGGHIEVGELPEVALKREVKEELNVRPVKFRLVAKLRYFGKQEHQLVYYFVVSKWKGKIKRKEAAKIFWLDFKEYKKLDLDVDKRAIKRVIN